MDPVNIAYCYDCINTRCNWSGHPHTDTDCKEFLDRRLITGGNILNLPKVDWRSKGWTIPGQIKKVLEEAGEVAEAIADQNYVCVIKESLDTMQTCMTMIDMVMDWNEYGQDFMLQMMQEHVEKLKRKGYLAKEG